MCIVVSNKFESPLDFLFLFHFIKYPYFSTQMPKFVHPILSQINNSGLYLAVFSAVLGNFNFGYSLVYSSPVLPKFQSPDADPRLRMNTEQAAWFGSIYSLGAVAGGLGAMLLNDLIGRKLSIMMSAVPSTVGQVSALITFHAVF